MPLRHVIEFGESYRDDMGQADWLVPDPSLDIAGNYNNTEHKVKGPHGCKLIKAANSLQDKAHARHTFAFLCYLALLDLGEISFEG